MFGSTTDHYHDFSLLYAEQREETGGKVLKLANGVNEETGLIRYLDNCTVPLDVGEARVGCPRLARLPVTIDPLFPDKKEDKRLINAYRWRRLLVKSYLKEVNFEYKSISLVYMTSIERCKPSPTILVTAKHRVPADSSWLDACVVLYKHYFAPLKVKFNLEIRGAHFPRAIRTAAIPSDHKIVSKWKVFHRYVLERLDRCYWTSFGMYLRDRGFQTEIPTLVITPQHDPSEGLLNYWRERRDAIMRDAKAVGWNDFAVELVTCQYMATQYLWNYNCTYARDYLEPARVGMSIGMKGNESRPWLTGTLGGFLSLELPYGDVKTLGMTCQHVLDSKDDVGGFLAEKILDDVLQKNYVCAPTKNDVIHHIRSRKQKLKGDRGMAGDAAFVEDAFDFEKNPESERLLRLGKVYATSEYPYFDEDVGTLDWGLIEIDRRRMPKFKAWERGAEVKTREPQGGETVHKRGRTTGITYGVINPIPDTLNIPAIFEGYDEPHITREWVVIGCHSSTQRDGCFSAKGDSGSFVYDESGELLGHVWASKKVVGCSYLIPIGRTIKDIKSVTGALSVKVLPAPIDECVSPVQEVDYKFESSSSAGESA